MIHLMIRLMRPVDTLEAFCLGCCSCPSHSCDYKLEGISVDLVEDEIRMNCGCLCDLEAGFSLLLLAGSCFSFWIVVAELDPLSRSGDWKLWKCDLVAM